MSRSDSSPPAPDGATLRIDLTPDELALLRRAVHSRADVHPFDWPANRATADSVRGKLDAASRVDAAQFLGELQSLREATSSARDGES